MRIAKRECTFVPRVMVRKTSWSVEDMMMTSSINRRGRSFQLKIFLRIGLPESNH